MGEPSLNKHQRNSALTREKLIDAAVALYGSRSIDAVSLREISVAAGQKNPNALQYHFHNRDGLLQAIIDKHASNIGALRKDYFQRAEDGEWSPGEAAARCLAMPIVDYVDANPEGLHFVNVISQLAAVYQNGLGTDQDIGIRFPQTTGMVKVFNRALSALPSKEAQRRRYLVVTITFHAIADIYRASKQQSSGSPVAAREPMVEQLICMLNSFFSAPSVSPG